MSPPNGGTGRGRRGWPVAVWAAGPALGALLALAACAAPVRSYRDPAVTIASAAAFDPVRYTGRWYEIARYPVPFQDGCTDTVADYDLRPDGSLGVVNTCRQGDRLRRIEGAARLVGPGRLAVRLEGVPFVEAPYWVLWVAEDYRTAVVGVPSGRAGWVLHRDPAISTERMRVVREVLDFNGYDPSRLVMTPQSRRAE